MVSYIVGVIFGILAGMLNFTGQVVQKKAINDMPAEIRAKNLMISLLHNKTWWLGIVFMSVFATVFQLTAAVTVGGTIMPGLMASGFIVLAIGSAKLLHENLKAGEIVAIGLLIFAIVLIGLSRLSIPQTPTYLPISMIPTSLYGMQPTRLCSWVCGWGFITGERKPNVMVP